MIIPDVNLLIYAYDAGSVHHQVAARWWSDTLSGDTPVGLPHISIFGFIRVSTNPRAFVHPKTIEEAAGHVRSWLDRPNVQIIQPGDGYTDRVLDLLRPIGTGGNLVADAQLAALAIEHHAVIHTADADFLRFPGVRWFNPITGLGTDTLRRRRPR